MIAGGPAPVIAAAILEHTGSRTGISWYIVGCCAVAVITLLFMPRQASALTASHGTVPSRGKAASSPGAL